MDAHIGLFILSQGPGSMSQAEINALFIYHYFPQERRMMWHPWTAFWENACCRHGGCAGMLCRRMTGMGLPCNSHGHALDHLQDACMPCETLKCGLSQACFTAEDCDAVQALALRPEGRGR